MSNKVLFSFRKETVGTNNTLLPGKMELFDKLRDRDLDPVVTLGGEGAFDEQGVATHELIGESETRGLGHAAIGEVGLIVNRLDRSFRYEESQGKEGDVLPKLPDAWQAAAKPIANENAMRSLAFRKEGFQRNILDPLQLGMPTQFVRNPLDAVVFAHENPADEYIIKPNSGTSGNGVMTVKSSELANIVIDGAKDMIIQPKYDFSGAMHPSIKPYDTLSDEAFAAWSKSETVKEIRMYTLLSPTKFSMFPVGRAFQDGVDHWFFIDPESVPDKLYDDTRSVMTLAAQETGSRAVSAALDFGYGSLNGETPDHHIVEYNGRMPYLVGYDKHAGVADKLRDHYADMVHDTINQ